MKLGKEHVGKKVKQTGLGNLTVCGLTSNGDSVFAEESTGRPNIFINHNDWELYQEPQVIPESQAWVIPGKKYALICWNNLTKYFQPEKFNFQIGFWEGFQRHGGRSPFTVSWSMNNQKDWIKYKPTVRMAPALIKILSNLYGKIEFNVTDIIFDSEEKAREYYNSKFVKWPASENLFVDVPVEEK